jgi:hypothetical protein
VPSFISSRSQNKLRKELTVEEHQSSKKRFDFYLSCCVYYFSSYDLRRAKGCLSENFSKRIVRVVLGMCIVNGSLSLFVDKVSL